MELEAGSHGTVYQVNYSEEDVGKIMKNSKVRITWDFVSHGSQKHKITLAWSKTTGKQELCMDGTVLWFGRNQGRSVLDHNWMTRDESFKLHVLATCAPKMNENFRNYDLLINGQLFASLPHYEREGLNAPVPQPMGQDNLNSIIQILYPEGYIPPVDRDHQQLIGNAPTVQQDSIVVAQKVDSIVAPSSSNGVSQQPMVDLLM